VATIFCAIRRFNFPVLIFASPVEESATLARRRPGGCATDLTFAHELVSIRQEFLYPVRMKISDEWRHFPDTGENGINPPQAGKIEVECRDKLTSIPGAPLARISVTWIPGLSGRPDGIGSHLEMLRWRHRDPNEARLFQQWEAEMDEAHRAGDLSTLISKYPYRPPGN
jgi:hypothetical protein